MNVDLLKAKEAKAASEAASSARRQRRASLSQSQAQRDAAVTFANRSADGTPERETRPQGSAGILKKGGGGGGGKAYHLMDEAPDTYDDEPSATNTNRTRADDTVSDSAPLVTSKSDSADGPTTDDLSARDAHFHHDPQSYTSKHEQAMGGIDLDTYGVRKANGVVRSATQSNGTSPSNANGRARSMSASTRSQRTARSGHSRRRSSMVEGTGNGNAAAVAAPKSKHYTRQPAWIAGIICVILGSLLDFAALAFVDQAVVAPLGSLTLVSNVFFSPLLLKEKVNRKQLYCTFLIIAGSCLAVAFAPHEDVSPNIDEMFANFARPRFIVYAIVAAGSLAALRFACWKMKKMRQADPSGPRYTRLARYHTFAYAACAGIMGAQSVLFAKCTAMLLAATFSGKGMMFVHWGTYFVLLGLGTTIFLQIRWLNSGLRLFSALLIVPIFQSFWILVSVIAGMIFFGEYEGVFGKAINAVFFPLGLLLTICGVYFLTRIAAPATVEDAAAANAANVSSGRRRSRSSAGRGSLSVAAVNGATPIVPNPAHAARASVALNGDAPLSIAHPGTVESPLLSNVGDHYGVTQSPRDHTTDSAQQSRRGSRLNGSAAGASSAASSAVVDRIVEVGSYSDSSNKELEGDDDDGGSSDENGSGGDDSTGSELDSPLATKARLSEQVALHSMAPLNGIFAFLPAALIEPNSPRPYFSENSSGFNDPGDISLGGLPYANIFRVREERASEFDEENPSSSPATPSQNGAFLGGINGGAGPGVNLFSSNSSGNANGNGNGNGNGARRQVSFAGVATSPTPDQWGQQLGSSASSSLAPSPHPSPPLSGGSDPAQLHALPAFSVDNGPSAPASLDVSSPRSSIGSSVGSSATPDLSSMSSDSSPFAHEHRARMLQPASTSSFGQREDADADADDADADQPKANKKKQKKKKKNISNSTNNGIDESLL